MLLILLLLFENIGAVSVINCVDGYLGWSVFFVSPVQVVLRIRRLKKDVVKDLVGYEELPHRWTEATECLRGKSLNRLLHLSTIEGRLPVYKRR